MPRQLSSNVCGVINIANNAWTGDRRGVEQVSSTVPGSDLLAIGRNGRMATDQEIAKIADIAKKSKSKRSDSEWRVAGESACVGHSMHGAAQIRDVACYFSTGEFMRPATDTEGHEK